MDSKPNPADKRARDEALTAMDYGTLYYAFGVEPPPPRGPWFLSRRPEHEHAREIESLWLTMGAVVGVAFVFGFVVGVLVV